MRRVWMIAVTSALLAPTFAALSVSASAARAQTPPPIPDHPRVVVLWIDATTFADWSRPGLTHFSRLLEQGSSALLSTWNGVAGSDASALRARAAQVVGLAAVDGHAPLSLRPDGLGGRFHLSDLLGAQGHASQLIGSGNDGAPDLLPVVRPFDPAVARTATPAVVRRDETFPSGERTDVDATVAAVKTALTTNDVVVIDFGDTARIERTLALSPTRAGWVRIAMRRADTLLGAVRALLTPADSFIAVSPTAAVREERAGIRLGSIAMVGPRTTHGLLWSRTTRIDGLASLADLPTTIADAVDAQSLGSMTGATLESRAERAPLAALTSLRSALVRANREHRPFTRALLAVISLAILLTFILVVAARGAPVRAGRIPRGARDLLATLMIAIAVTPACALIAAPLGAVAGGVAALILGLGLRALLGRERGFACAALTSAVVAVMDLATGGALGISAPLSTPVANGVRFHGADPIAIGLIIGLASVGAALLLDRARVPARAAPWLLGSGAVVAWTLGAPFAGDLPGAVFIVMPVACVLAARAYGMRFDARAITASFAATTIVAGVIVTTHVLYRRIDTLTAPAGHTVLNATARVRLHAFAPLLRSAWPVALAVCLVPIVVLALRRRDVVARALWGRTNLRAACTAAAAGSVGGLLGLRGGLVTAVWLALVTIVALSLTLVGRDP